ncbi:MULTISPECIES: endo alpha-1,4 polygalactosaminidase [Kitasatospora]|uniref:endo alpha-1,4 polygalactosaminidase n=1 Tax=Kitasatospora cathayae TaxID=3004092 RepID=UPI002FD7C7E9
MSSRPRPSPPSTDSSTRSQPRTRPDRDGWTQPARTDRIHLGAAEVGLIPEPGFDFVVSEKCGATGECDRYASAYGGRVLDIEYGDASFVRVAKACDGWKSSMSVGWCDRDLTAPGDSKVRLPEVRVTQLPCPLCAPSWRTRQRQGPVR